MTSPTENDPSQIKVEPGTLPAPGNVPARLAQDFRLELTAIIDGARSLAAELEEPKRADYVRQILASAGRLLQMVDKESGAAMAAPKSAVAPVGEQATPHSVLYIEDDLVNFKLVLRILAGRTGIRLVHALNGEAGLAAALSSPPAVILLDLNLPDVHGSEVLRRLQESPITAQIPVIVISADATASQIERLLSAGARDYLIKPFSIQKFLGVMDGAVEAANRRARN